jgi:hypothetical protein
MIRPIICTCPFTSWCHEPRQWLAVKFDRQQEKCDFYKKIKEMEEKHNDHNINMD